MNQLRIALSQDAFGSEDAQCLVHVDGRQYGDVFTISSKRGEMLTLIEVAGDWPIGHHMLSVTFLNDVPADQSPGEARNLYIEAAAINGAQIPIVPTPLKLSRHGPCPPIGFEVYGHLFSIPDAFAALNKRFDVMHGHLHTLMRAQGLAQESAEQCEVERSDQTGADLAVVPRMAPVTRVADHADLPTAIEVHAHKIVEHITQREPAAAVLAEQNAS